MTIQTKRVGMPTDFVNVGTKTVTTSTNDLPVALKLMAIVLGTVGVMTILNMVYMLAAGH